MNQFILTCAAALIFLGASSTLTAQTGPTSEGTPSLTKPLILEPKDLIPDSTRFQLPPLPRKGPNGDALELDIDKDNIPVEFSKLGLADPLNLVKIPEMLKNDDKSRRYYWRTLAQTVHCHYRDGDRDWFGWATGATFHWVLWRGGRFWWRDDYAQRWVYWDQGNWWWQGRSKDKPRFQTVLGDGFYHACDANGLLGDNLMRTGKTEIVTEPAEKSQSDLAAESKRHSLNGDHEIGE